MFVIKRDVRYLDGPLYGGSTVQCLRKHCGYERRHHASGTIGQVMQYAKIVEVRWPNYPSGRSSTSSGLDILT